VDLIQIMARTPAAPRLARRNDCISLLEMRMRAAMAAVRRAPRRAAVCIGGTDAAALEKSRLDTPCRTPTGHARIAECGDRAGAIRRPSAPSRFMTK
jgi:hypothetical protein